jgi:hypothetical protein
MTNWERLLAWALEDGVITFYEKYILVLFGIFGGCF